jgi:hypothetical protein
MRVGLRDVDPAAHEARHTEPQPARGQELQSDGMTLDLFAGVRVRDYAAARPWYERLLGSEPSFLPNATEAVWELAEHRWLFIVEDAESPGGALQTILVDDLDALIADIGSRGIEPDELVTYSNGVRKAIYRDADANEIGFGGSPA